MLRRADQEPAPIALGRQDDLEPYRIVDGDFGAGLVVVCDHATNAIPAEYGDLGVGEIDMSRHIAYDIGVAGVTEGIAERLGVPAVLCGFSRLLIDPNRGRDDPTLVMRLSDGAVVPGNARIDESEIENRVARYYDPYHDAVTQVIDRCIDTGRPPVLFSIHSFTPVWRGSSRPWHAGVLWDKDPRFAVPLIRALEDEGDLVVGDNEPYRGFLKGDCMYRHGTGRGLAHALIEVRQDLIKDIDGISEWVERLVRILPKAMTDEDAHLIRHYGSHSD